VLAGWSNTAGKHEVEQLRFTDFIIGIRVPKIVVSTEFCEFRARIVVKLNFL
jgi:hypothetical protein